MFSDAPVLTQVEPSGLSAMANLERWKNPETPSTKLVAMVNMLKEWESDPATSMDKVIIYSQCKVSQNSLFGGNQFLLISSQGLQCWIVIMFFFLPFRLCLELTEFFSRGGNI